MKKILLAYLPSLITVMAGFFSSVMNFYSNQDSIWAIVSLVTTGIGAIGVTICFIISLYESKKHQESR